MGERTQQSRDSMSTLFYSMAISTVFWLIFSPWWNFDWSKYADQVSLGGNLSAVEMPAWVLLVWLGVMGSFVPMMLSYKALAAALEHLPLNVRQSWRYGGEQSQRG